MITIDGDVVVVLESERQRWTDTVVVDDSLSRELVMTIASVLTNREWFAHAAPPRDPEEHQSSVRSGQTKTNESVALL